jgi:hypothetical protein
MGSQTVSLDLLKMGRLVFRKYLRSSCIHAQLCQISKLLIFNGGAFKNRAAVAKQFSTFFGGFFTGTL